MENFGDLFGDFFFGDFEILIIGVSFDFGCLPIFSGDFEFFFSKELNSLFDSSS